MVVAIPTKGRPGTNTYKIYEDLGWEVYHFVEPQDYNSYKKKGVPNLITLEKNDKGISFVRNNILAWAKAKNIEWLCVSDDDVTHFGVFKGGKTVKDNNSLKDIESKLCKIPFTIVGMSYIQYAWTEKNKHSINKSFVEVVVFINVGRVSWEYDELMVMKEDRDFALNAVKKSQGIFKFNWHFFSCPGVGTNKGGLHENYKNKLDEAKAKEFAKKWQPFVKLKNKKGRLDVSVNIKLLAKKYNRQVL